MYSYIEPWIELFSVCMQHHKKFISAWIPLVRTPKHRFAWPISKKSTATRNWLAVELKSLVDADTRNCERRGWWIGNRHVSALNCPAFTKPGKFDHLFLITILGIHRLHQLPSAKGLKSLPRAWYTCYCHGCTFFNKRELWKWRGKIRKWDDLVRDFGI